MVKLCRDLRKDVLEKQKAMPKKESGNRVPPTRPRKQAAGSSSQTPATPAPVQDAAAAPAPAANPVQDAGAAPATKEVKSKQAKSKAPAAHPTPAPAGGEKKAAAPKPKAPKTAAAAH